MNYELKHTYTFEEMKEMVESHRAMWFDEYEINWSEEEIISYFEKIVGGNRESIEYYIRENKENNTIDFYELVYKWN